MYSKKLCKGKKNILNDERLKRKIVKKYEITDISLCNCRKVSTFAHKLEDI